MLRTIPLPNRLRLLQNPPHLRLLPLAQLNLPRSKVLLQPPRLGSPRDSNEPLRRDPREGDLGKRTPLPRGELLDLLDDGFVLVEVLALEFGGCLREGGQVSN